MLLSRGTRAVRAISRLQSVSAPLKTSIRNSGHAWYYRSAGKPAPWVTKAAEGVQGFAWWWVLWHLWTEPDHILGEFEWPDPSKWSDAELGIPEEV